VFPIVLWAVIGVAAAVVSLGFFTRYRTGSATGSTESNPESHNV